MRTLPRHKAPTRPQARSDSGKSGSWYRIDNKAGADTAQVLIYEEIGFWGVTAAQFAREVNALDVATLDVRVNSPGGDVFDGVTIYNTLVNHKATVNMTVDGLAASAASFILQAGDTRTMGTGTELMIHDALALAFGNAADMRATADILDRISNDIAGLYAERAGGNAMDWRAAMQAETWYSAQEAVDAGLADATAASSGDGAGSATDQWDLSVFSYAGRGDAPAPPTIRPAAATRAPVDAASIRSILRGAFQ